MVELEDDQIRFPAVDARVFSQVLGDSFPMCGYYQRLIPAYPGHLALVEP